MVRDAACPPGAGMQDERGRMEGKGEEWVGWGGGGGEIVPHDGGMTQCPGANARQG